MLAAKIECKEDVERLFKPRRDLSRQTQEE